MTNGSPPDTLAIIQARMSSSRFPGKVLAPLAGRPVVDHVVERVAKALGPDRVVVATSTESSDNPLVHHLVACGTTVFRGDLEDCVSRYQACLRAHPCDWFVRICADSPLTDPDLIQRVVDYGDRRDADLVTNRQRRTFPVGQSVEMVRSQTFLKLNPSELTPEQREHATAVFYDHPEDYRIVNLESDNPSLGELHLAVDTPEDLRRLDKIVASGEDPRASFASKRLGT